jgi:hypothetical protein
MSRPKGPPRELSATGRRRVPHGHLGHRARVPHPDRGLHQRLRGDFAFVILASIAVDVAAQVNVWRVLGVARRRGQELASELVPGLGAVVALLVACGGLVFNVGNIAGCGLGLAVLGVPASVGAVASATAAVALLSLPRAARAMDVFANVLGAVMILLTAAVMVSSRPDYGPRCAARWRRGGSSCCRSSPWSGAPSAATSRSPARTGCSTRGSAARPTSRA